MRRKSDTISRITKGLRKFFEPEKRTVAVEIDNDIVKVVEALGTDGTRKLVRVDEAALSREDTEPLSGAMKRLFGSSQSCARDAAHAKKPAPTSTTRTTRAENGPPSAYTKRIPDTG